MLLSKALKSGKTVNWIIILIVNQPKLINGLYPKLKNQVKLQSNNILIINQICLTALSNSIKIILW